ncbi:MAG: SLBB domain-containing protein [Thiomargarita sp.]|nr:SLBB domain-containing protein [Thiomargarita sp.]
MERLNQVLLHEKSRVGADLEAWLAHCDGLKIALQEPTAIIPLIKEAGLRGLGGSGFPTHYKWTMLAEQTNSKEKYLICNGNEDEPGTFKDSILLEKTPHQVIEGAMIAALATGINRIVFYINPDLEEAIANMQKAVKQWEESEFYFKVSDHIKQPLNFSVLPSSGHYIGGEETATIETVEGKFPFPRRKPPYPAEKGVYGCPTLINNIETLCNVPHILKNGAKWFQDLGIDDAYGTKIYSLSGDVLSPGVYELPMGTSLSELINDYGGGMLLNKKFKAVFTGGPSNTLLTPKDLDVHLDFDSVAARRSGLGTGAMIVISEGTGIVKRVAEYVSFFAHSSCGQCPSCKTGTYYIAMLLNKIDTGRGRRADLDALINLCEILPGSGRCGLINGAVKALESSLYHFMGEYEHSLK